MTKRHTLGLIEHIILNNKEEVLARIDTGATTSSMDTELAQKLNLGPAHRHKTIKSASGVNKRPVVHCKISIANQELEAEFTLADRTHMTYDVLVGQNILKEGKFLIDPLKELSK